MQGRYTMGARAQLVTAEEFARIPNDDYHYELVAGRVVRVSPPGSRHAVLATRLAVLLARHADEHRLGVVMTPAGFHLARNPDTVREPDVAFVRGDRVPPSGVPDGFWPGPPDLAVEIRSPGDRDSEIRAKIADYLARGVRLVWIVDSRQRTVTIHDPLAPPRTLDVDDVLDGGSVIDGFVSPVRRIFD